MNSRRRGPPDVTGFFAGGRRVNVAQFDDVAEASAAGVSDEFLGLFAHANVWPTDDPGLRETARAYMGACRGLAERMLRVADYLATYGRPEQIAAWRDGTPFVADLAENSAGRKQRRSEARGNCRRL